jgi:hypothetical protein
MRGDTIAKHYATAAESAQALLNKARLSGSRHALAQLRAPIDGIAFRGHEHVSILAVAPRSAWALPRLTRTRISAASVWVYTSFNAGCFPVYVIPTL